MRIAIADDAGLIYSDDYRDGWLKGFQAIGCEVKRFDIRQLRKIVTGLSPYKSSVMPGTGKALGKQIADWKPDLVWCHHGRAASNRDFLEALHSKGIKTAVYLCDEPYEVGETAIYSPRFRFVFTMDPCTVIVHRNSREDRSNVFYLPPCADVERFPFVKYDDRRTPAFFLGNATLAPRPRWLEPILRLINGADIRFFQSVHKGHHKWVGLEDHARLYSGCIVGLNVHRHPGITKECYRTRVLRRSPSAPKPAGLELCPNQPTEDGTGFWNDGNLPAAHLNPRFFEMASCGTLVVSDDSRPELERMFPMAPRAQDPEHFYELVRYYIDHPIEAADIGQVCSSLISRRHSYAHRAAEILIRVGLQESATEDQLTSWGEQADWLSPQDCSLQGIKSSLDLTGPSERWSPQYGLSLTRMSGRVKDSTSIDVPTPWSS